MAGPPRSGAVVRRRQRRLEEHYAIPADYGYRNWTANEDCEEGHFMKNFFSKRLTGKHGLILIIHAWKDWLKVYSK